MAKKPTITTVASGFQSTATINNNFQNLKDAFDNTLSLDGSTPNAMNADLDMNGNDIINVGSANGNAIITVNTGDARYVNTSGDTMTGSLNTPALYTNGLYINGNPVLPSTLTYNGIVKESKVSTSGQTVFNLSGISYTPGINNLSVYVDGVYQKPSNYTETSATVVTFSVGLHVGAIVDFVVLGINSLSGTADAVNLTYTAPGTGANTRTVYSKLTETISVKDFGAVGDGTTNDTAAIQEAINALSSNQTLLFEGNFRITNSLTITSKTRVRLTGKGRIFFDSAPSGGYIFFLVGTIDNLEIDSLTLVGDNNISYTQGAIGCDSGQTISNTRFHDLQISNVNVGISHNANLSGSWTNGWCYNNYLTNIIGTVSGSGYGIQAARAYNLHIYGNTINNASRHSIYVGRGHNLSCIIENNTILNHRKDVADGGPRGAIDVGRTSGVIISNNTFRDCYDGMIYLGADTGTSDDNYDILICGNKFGTPKNAAPAVWLGEQLTPTTARMYSIDILDNTFEQDCSLTTGVVINLLNGNGITVKNNRLRAYNVAAALPIFVLLGDSNYISSNADISEITVADNVCLSDKGSVVSGSRILFISDQLCTGTSVYTAKNNSGKDWATGYYFEVSPPTNLNSKLKFTTTITHTWSVPANSNGSGAFSVQGCKPTSSVTVRANSGTMAAPFLAIGGYASTTINTVEMYAVNPSSTLTSTQTSMVHRIFIEDF